MKKSALLVLFAIMFVYLVSLIPVLLNPSINSNREMNLKFEPASLNLSLQPIEVVNPSFEIGNSQVIGWEAVTWIGESAFTQSKDYARTGTCSSKISATSSSSSAFISNSSSKYPVVAGKSYLASSWVIANFSQGVGAIMGIAWFDSNNTYLSTTIGEPLSYAYNWTNVFASGEAPKNAVESTLELHLSGVGTVYYDDVNFSMVTNQYIDNSWSASRQGLENAVLEANSDSLLLNGTFVYAGHEKLTLNMSLQVDIQQYTFMTVDYRTSDANGAGLSIVLDYTDGTQLTAYGPAFSEQFMTANIDPRKTPAYIYYAGPQRQTAKSTTIQAIEISLDDKPDSIASGTYWLQIRNITFYKTNTSDMLFLAESSLFLVTVFAVGVRSKEHEKYFVLAIIGSALCFVASTAIFLLPNPIQIDSLDLSLFLQIIGLLISIAGIIASKIKFYSRTVGQTSRKLSRKLMVFCIIGFIIIPSIAFMVRLNNALTIPMFDDELSYGISSLQITHGSLLGLNLASAGSVPQALMDTGNFKVYPWPSGLAIPYTSTSLYPNFTLVGPYFGEPFLGALLVAPFTNLMGLSTLSIRLPFILFSVGTAILIFVIALRKGHPLTGVLASAFFAFMPYLSHYGSEAFLDNILAFFLMASILFLMKYIEMPKPKRDLYLYLSIGFAALCALTKIQGVFVSVFVLAILLFDRVDRKRLFWGSLLYLGLVGLFPLSGLIVSPRGFLLSLRGLFQLVSNTANTQLSNVSGFFSFYDLFSIWGIVIAVLSIVYLIAEEKNGIFGSHEISGKEILLIGGASWVLYGLLFSLKEWYLISFFAVTAILVGYAYSDVMTKYQGAPTVLFIALMSTVSLGKLNVPLAGIAAFLFPLVCAVVVNYLEVKQANLGSVSKRILPWLITSYLVASFVLMIASSWNYRFWA